LKVLGAEPATRRIAVLGEMRELGDDSDAYHAALAAPLGEASVSYAILVGDGMSALAKALEGQIDFVHVATAAQAHDALNAVLSPGDAVLIKGSNAVGLSALVASLSGRG
jgi:UDP-N-acetylmuramoyl-tripeptide--D-alanyl-D-alanine ligase